MNNTLKFRTVQKKLDFNDVLIIPRRSSVHSRSVPIIQRTINFKTQPLCTNWTGVPIVSSNMDTVTGLHSFNVLRLQNYLSCFPKHLNKEWDSLKRLPSELQFTEHYMLSCGIKEHDYNLVFKLIDRMSNEGISVKFLCVDIANGYLTEMLDVCSIIRDKYPKMVITAGNVVTPEATYDLIKSGANIIKIGIGSSGVCTTRLKTGVGYPQLSAVLECADIAHRHNGYIMSDGGIVHPADIVKAYVAGADFVMIGSMFAGHTESPGELHLNPKDNEWYKTFYGMASETALEQYNNKRDYRTAEGKKVNIKHKGALINTLYDINGGIRSACTYTNSLILEELYQNGEFICVSRTHNNNYS
jgi:GMP reductase